MTGGVCPGRSCPAVESGVAAYQPRTDKAVQGTQWRLREVAAYQPRTDKAVQGTQWRLREVAAYQPRTDKAVQGTQRGVLRAGVLR